MGKMKKESLYDIIVSRDNIYKAIYCLESYICERGLLDNEDLKLYYSLHDKFDFESIEPVMAKCEDKLKDLLKSTESQNFSVTVYFKLKKYKEDKIVYRPMHTASLEDQICMAAMLIPLMFDDSGVIRKRSELTKIIPDNFFGNIPGNKMEDLFRPWMRQYKTYSDRIIEKSKEYRNNRKYNTEVTLDLKEFFPSVSPAFIFCYVMEKMSCVYTTEEDKETLKKVLHKLMFLKIEKENIKDWGTQYYGDKFTYAEDKEYFTRGIPQGLPQSYFFGNLCMIEVKDILFKNKIFKDADALFYVDDSVIYVENEFVENDFKKDIQDINRDLAEIGSKEKTEPQFLGMLTETEKNAFHSMEYKIEFHDSDKSEYCDVEEAGFKLSGLENLARSTSMAAKVFENLDETDDRMSREKLTEIDRLITDEIRRVERILSKEEPSYKFDGNKRNHLKCRLKLLNRYKRFFLYRLKWLDQRLDEDKDWSQIFRAHFKLNELIGDKGPNINIDTFRKDWFGEFDRDIFQSESRLLVSSLPFEQAEALWKDIRKFEQCLTETEESSNRFLYFTKDIESTFVSRGIRRESYIGLENSIRRFAIPQSSLSVIRQKEIFEKWLSELIGYREYLISNFNDSSISDVKNEKFYRFLPEYTRYVFVNSDEFVRKILNAYCSILNEVTPSDARSFTKMNSRGLSYAEFRILMRLRNRNFDVNSFVRSVKEMDTLDLDNRMQIDLGLLEVVSEFIKYVKNPEWIDNIILTHRITKSLWYNGSKFMNSYTLHNEEHAVTLIKWIVKLVNAIDYFNIKSTDYYILFLACYLHDISMVIHPPLDDFSNNDSNAQQRISNFREKWKIASEPMTRVSTPDVDFKRMGKCLIDMFNNVYEYFSDKVRNSHTTDSAAWIRYWKDSVLRYLDPLVVSETAFVAESHGFDTKEVYGLTSRAANEVIGEKYMMILIRLADLMDVANDRINYNLLRQNVKYLSEISRFHWISHLITDEIRLEPTYKADSASIKPIESRRIIERLNINLYLNVEFMAGIERRCRECHKKDIDWEIVKVTKEYEGYEGFSLSMFGVEDNSDSNTKCPLLCRWCLKKHEWMMEELKELNRYLNNVNDRWFKTEIRLNVLYKDNMMLDGDLYHAAQEYIKKAGIDRLDRRN